VLYSCVNICLSYALLLYGERVHIRCFTYLLAYLARPVRRRHVVVVRRRDDDVRRRRDDVVTTTSSRRRHDVVRRRRHDDVVLHSCENICLSFLHAVVIRWTSSYTMFHVSACVLSKTRTPSSRRRRTTSWRRRDDDVPRRRDDVVRRRRHDVVRSYVYN